MRREDGRLLNYFVTLGWANPGEAWQFLDSLRSTFGTQLDLWPTPPMVLDFVIALLQARQAKSVLDPCARHGLLAALLTKKVPLTGAVAIADRPEIERVRGKSGYPEGMRLVVGHAREELPSLSQRFDAIVSELPVGSLIRDEQISIGGQERSLRVGHGDAILLSSLANLAPDGAGVFVVAPSFLWARGSAREHLMAASAHITAFIEIPAGSYSPVTTIPFGLVVIERQPVDQVFVGALSESAERNRLVLDNLLARRSGTEAALGAMVALETFRGLRSMQSAERIAKLAKPYGTSPVNLDTLALSINFTRDVFEEHPNCLYLPKIGNSVAVASTADLKIKPQNYAQVVLDPAKVNARFAAAFFSTELGLLIRESGLRGTTIPKLNKASIAELPTYVPPIADQIRVLETDAQVTTLAAEAHALTRRLWARPRDVANVAGRLRKIVRSEQGTDWIEDLPFPLATIAWAWHTAGNDDRRRCDALLHLFEAYAEFTATVLLSAFSKDEELFASERAIICDQLIKTRSSVATSSFGTWMRIIEPLAKRGRVLLQGNDQDQERCFTLFRTRNRAFLAALFSRSIIGSLQETNGIRNKLRHAGAIGDADAHAKHVVLGGHLATLRAELGDAWDGMTVVLPTLGRFSQGVHHYTANRLMGTRTPFESIDLELTEPLEDQRLYLVEEEASRGLQLLPLVRVMASPRSAQNACYFYSRRQADGVRFVSYHFAQDSEVTKDFPDTVEALRNLFPDEFAS